MNADSGYIHFTTILLLIFFLLGNYSEENRVIIKLEYPENNRIDVNEVWKISKIMNLSSYDYTVYLRGVVSVTNSDKENWVWDASSSSFTLSAGTTINSIDVCNLQPIKALFNPKFKYISEQLAKTGYLPENTYLFCIYVMNKTTNQVLAKDCIQYTISQNN